MRPTLPDQSSQYRPRGRSIACPRARRAEMILYIRRLLRFLLAPLVFRVINRWRRIAIFLLKPVILEVVNTQVRVWGPHDRIEISPLAEMVNTLFNTSSGRIEVGDWTFAGHNVSLITGTHPYDCVLKERHSFPQCGRDIIIGRGVWIGSNAVVLGPCNIGDHAVIAAGAVVTPGTNVAERTMVAGVPARIVKTIAMNSDHAANEGGTDRVASL